MKRAVFFVSDHTGITAETLGRSLLAQFEGVSFNFNSWPFLDNEEKAHQAKQQIDYYAREDGARPLVFSTLVNPALRAIIKESEGVLIDFFETFSEKLQSELGDKPTLAVGRYHNVGNYAKYTARIDALNFALSNDDGVMSSNYPAADIVLLGVSRSGKTPTSLYLALQYGILAGNYPITEDDLEMSKLPASLKPYKDRLFGLTINPDRLQQIRSERLPDSRYATYKQCEFEVRAVETLYRREGIRFLNTTSMSIEEIAATILQQAGIKRRLYN